MQEINWHIEYWYENFWKYYQEIYGWKIIRHVGEINCEDRRCTSMALDHNQ
jgi:hypothetical protein